jgi:hypothetical protein
MRLKASGGTVMNRHTHGTFCLYRAIKVVIGCFLFFVLITSPFDNPARAQQNDPPIDGGGFMIATEMGNWQTTVEYSRRGALIYYLQPLSMIDWDFDPWGYLYQDIVWVAAWNTTGANGQNAGGQFGRYNGTTFTATSDTDPYANAYQPDPNFVGILSITMTVDDWVLWHDDPAVTSNPWQVTVWEFTISNGAAGWMPTLDSDLYFTANITPATDHNGNSMARTISFQLFSSREPGYCMNATRERTPRQWDDTYDRAAQGVNGPDNDLKLWPDQTNLTIISQDQNNQFNFNNAITNSQVTTATVRVRCLDYGPRNSQIDAIASFPDMPIASARLEGTLPQDGKFGAQIPIDTNFNGIVDAWIYESRPEGDEDDNPIQGFPGVAATALCGVERGVTKMITRYKDFLGRVL